MKPKKQKDRKIGTRQLNEKKPLINPRYKNLFYTIAFIVIVLFFFIVNNSVSEPDNGPYPPGYEPTRETDRLTKNLAPEFEFVSTYGKAIRLSDYRGKIVILDFWATWCSPCRASIPDLISLKKDYKNDLEIIGISLDGITRGGATKSDVFPFISQYGINYPVVHGDEKIIMDYGGIQSIPTSFVIDQKGNIVASHIGLVSKSDYKKEIDALILK